MTVTAPNDFAINGLPVDAALQVEREIEFVSNVTAPFRAKARPDRVAPVLSVMLVNARILPWNFVVVPRVAELPICQNTLQADPPLMIFTEELLAVVRALPI